MLDIWEWGMSKSQPCPLSSFDNCMVVWEPPDPSILHFAFWYTGMQMFSLLFAWETSLNLSSSRHDQRFKTPKLLFFLTQNHCLSLTYLFCHSSHKTSCMQRDILQKEENHAWQYISTCLSLPLPFSAWYATWYFIIDLLLHCHNLLFLCITVAGKFCSTFSI